METRPGTRIDNKWEKMFLIEVFELVAQRETIFFYSGDGRALMCGARGTQEKIEKYRKKKIAGGFLQRFLFLKT